MIKKQFLLFFLVSSCSNIPFPLYERGFENISTAISSKDPLEIDEVYISNKRFDSIRVRIGRAPSVIMVLVREKNGIKEWISADNIKLFTYKGRIVATRGMRNDIKLSNYPLDINITNKTSYYVDYFEPELLNQLIFLESIYVGRKSIKNIIKERPGIEVDLYEEKITNTAINWNTKSKFYYKDGAIVRSEQYIHPFINKISIDYIDAYFVR